MVSLLLPLVVLALMQGVLEFLPVSSEGQLLLVAVNLFNIDPNTALSMAIWLHLGTALTVLIFYRKDIFAPFFQRVGWIKAPPDNQDPQARTFVGPLFSFVIVGTAGTILVALPLYLLLRSLVSQLMGEVVSALIGGLLLLTGTALYFQRKAKGTRALRDISLIEALLLGLIQGVAVLPGISRSGMTLTWLLLRGVERDEALRLSFILGIPASLGVTGLDFLFGTIFWADPLSLITITLIAMLTGLLTLWALRYSAIKVPFWAFVLILGTIVLALTIPTILTMNLVPP